MKTSIDLIRRAYETGDLEGAERLLRSYLGGAPDDGRAWELAGLVQYALDRCADAVSALERASLLVPLRPSGRVCLGHAYGKIGRRALSRDLLVHLIWDDSIPPALLLQVAAGLDAIACSAAAMQACRRATERDPQFAQAYYDLGYYAARCGYEPRYTEALARKAIALDPDNVCYRIGLASHLVRQRRTEEAFEVVEALTDDQIQTVDCSCCLGRVAVVYEQVGDDRRALLCHQRLADLKLHGTDSDCE